MNLSRARHGRGARRRLNTLSAPVWLLVVFAHLNVCFVFAQNATTGAIQGQAIDAQGAPIPGADVTLINLAQGTRTLTQSSAGGDFLAPSLAPAEYSVDIQSADRGAFHLDRILVEVGGTARMRAVLARATLKTEVSVNTDARGDIDEPGASTFSVISGREILQLPSNGQRWQSLALLNPQTNSASPSEDVGLLSFRGIASTQNSSRVDGADDDQSFSGTPHGSGTDAGPETEDEAESEGQGSDGNSGRDFTSGSGGGRRPGAAYTFSQAAVLEFRVVGQSYSALYGHASGSVITTVSKSGTDTLHGSAFYFLRESAWAASNPFSVATSYEAGKIYTSLVKPSDHRDQFGGTLGGPMLVKRYPHHFFYFYAFDAQRRSFPAISSPEDPAFYALTATQQALLANRGVTPAAVSAALTYLDSLTGIVPRRADQTVNFLKLDAQLTSKHRFTLQYNRPRFRSPAGIRSAPVVNRGTRSFGSQAISVDSVLGRWLYTRNATLSNELHVQYSRDHHSEQAQSPLPQEPAIAPGGLSPEIAIGPQGFSFGTPASVGKQAAPDEHRVQLADVAMFVHGRNFIQGGFDWSYVHDFTDSLTNSAGTFHYDSGVTGGRAGGLVDWITDFTFDVNSYPNGGCPSINSPVHDFCFRSFSQSFGQQTARFSTQEFAGFLQDRWRPTEALSFTAGLRYEYELLPIPQHPNPAVDAIFGQRGATGIFPEDRNNAGPRVAAAWQPFGESRGTVRIAYGLYFGRLPGATIRSALVDTGTSSSATRIRILPSTVTECPQVPNQGFGYPCTFTSAPPAGVAATTSITVFDRRFRLPTLQQGSFSIEREVGKIASVSASYLLNLDRQLPNSVDINIAPSVENRTFRLQGGTGTVGVRDGDSFVLPFYTQRLSSSFGPVTAVSSNANATYNALVLEARHRSRAGLEFRASYTWSKSIDFGQNTGSVPRTNGQLDPFDIRYDKAISALNFPHKLVASAVWQTEPASGLSLVRHLTGGWILAPLLTESSGRPYSYNIFGGTRLSGGHESINGSGGDVYLPSVGRNTLRLPDSFDLDMRLSREILWAEHRHLRAIAEAYNLTNHVNYASITERAFLVGSAVDGVTPLIFQNAAAIGSEGLNSRPFGAFTSSSTQSARERQLQFGLRLDF